MNMFVRRDVPEAVRECSLKVRDSEEGRQREREGVNLSRRRNQHTGFMTLLRALVSSIITRTHIHSPSTLSYLHTSHHPLSFLIHPHRLRVASLLSNVDRGSTGPLPLLTSLLLSYRHTEVGSQMFKCSPRTSSLPTHPPHPLTHPLLPSLVPSFTLLTLLSDFGPN